MKTTDKLGLQYLNDLKARAILNGGECLSKEYINYKTRMLWRCNKGHTWEAASTSIKQGSWCPVCGKRKGSIEEMQRIAEEREGKCLSNEYSNANTKLEWQCKEGHKWNALPCEVKRGTWCMLCKNNNLKSTIEEMQQIAAERGGKCVSKSYVNGATKLKWKCKKRHTWEATPTLIKLGHWCAICAINATKITIEEMQQLAATKGGKCLSKEYINCNTKLEWQCEEGHVWNNLPYKMKQGKWCPVCEGRKVYQKGTIENMQLIAKKRGGKCLSEKYIESSTLLLWCCKEGHKWNAQANSVKQGSWCPVCGRIKGSPKDTIENMRLIAKNRDGKCLSKEYIGSKIHLLWCCKKGHKWNAKPTNVKQGRWCPICCWKKS